MLPKAGIMSAKISLPTEDNIIKANLKIAFMVVEEINYLNFVINYLLYCRALPTLRALSLSLSLSLNT